MTVPFLDAHDYLIPVCQSHIIVLISISRHPSVRGLWRDSVSLVNVHHTSIRVRSCLDLKPLACWDRVFETNWGHGWWSLVLVACYVASDICRDEQITLLEESYRVRVSSFVWSRNRVCGITELFTAWIKSNFHVYLYYWFWLSGWTYKAALPFLNINF